jgi:hypothetical protein
MITLPSAFDEQQRKMRYDEEKRDMGDWGIIYPTISHALVPIEHDSGT